MANPDAAEAFLVLLGWITGVLTVLLVLGLVAGGWLAEVIRDRRAAAEEHEGQVQP